eukprot:tig00021257_g19747.t1
MLRSAAPRPETGGGRHALGSGRVAAARQLRGALSAVAETAPTEVSHSEDAPSPIALLPDELLVKILRAGARELPRSQGGCQWPAALRNANELRAVCKRFKEEIDAAGGPLALFESVGWDEEVERWLEGRPGGVDAFLAERAPRLTGLRDVAVVAEHHSRVKHGARFLAALPCWPSLVSLRLLSLPPGATGELRACLDALAAVPAAKLSLNLLEVDVNAINEHSRGASALVRAIVRRCASSLRTLELASIALEGRWEDLLPSGGLRELRISLSPRPVALGGLERSGAAATLETLELDIAGGDPFAGRGGPGSALALAALPALSRLTIDTSLAGPGLGPAPHRLLPPPDGSFPALRSLALCGPCTRSDWWAAVLASPAGAHLESLSLAFVSNAGRVLEAIRIRASGPPSGLRALFLSGCAFAKTDADSLFGFLAGLPALRSLTVRDCDEDANGNAEAGREGSRGALAPPPEGSFPALRDLTLGGPSTRFDWWAAALASCSRAGAALESLALEKVPAAWSILAALHAPGSPPALRKLSLTRCDFGAEEAAGLAGLLAACPALQELSIRQCPGVQPAPAAAPLPRNPTGPNSHGHGHSY